MEQEQKCAYFDRGECKSCSLLALPFEKRAEHKYSRFIAAARDVIGPGVPILPLWQPPKIFPSRTKAKLSVSGSMANPIIGLVDRELAATELLDCPLHLPELNAVL